MASFHEPDPPRSSGTASEDAASGRHRRARFVFQTVLDLFIRRIHILQGAATLAVASALLIAAWNAGPGRRSAARGLDTLSGRGQGEIERFWWRIDFEPRYLGASGTNWPGLTRPEMCVRLLYREMDGAGATHRAVYCRGWQELYGLYLIHSTGEAAPGVRPTWLGEDGLPTLELHLSPRAHRWLADRPPVAWVADTWQYDRVERQAESALDVLDIALDTPLEHLAREWSSKAAQSNPSVIPIAYDPADRGRALPVSLLEEVRRAQDETGPIALAVLLAAGVFWTVGWVFLAGGFGRRRRLVIAVVLSAATLVLLPWWGNRAGDLLSKVWAPAGLLVVFLSSEILPGPPTVELRPPDYRGEPEDIRRIWSLKTSRFADLLDRLDLRPPVEATSEAELLDRLAATARARLPDGEERDDLLAGAE